LNRILLLTGFGHINIEKNGYYEKPFWLIIPWQVHCTSPGNSIIIYV
jgi:hypothetical protein